MKNDLGDLPSSSNLRETNRRALSDFADWPTGLKNLCIQIRVDALQLQSKKEQETPVPVGHWTVNTRVGYGWVCHGLVTVIVQADR